MAEDHVKAARAHLDKTALESTERLIAVPFTSTNESPWRRVNRKRSLRATTSDPDTGALEWEETRR
jgi:hypothetical protein